MTLLIVVGHAAEPEQSQESPLISVDWAWFWETSATIIASLFLLLTVIIFCIELYETRSRSEIRRYCAFKYPASWKLRLACLWVLAAGMILRTFRDKTKACKPSLLNADIGGIGVLIGLYAPLLAIAISLGLQHWTGSETGTKELGSIVLMNVVFLILNLVKSLGKFSRLSYVDLLVVFMSMDGSNATLLMTRCNKECLAARTYIRLCNLFQPLSLIVQIVGLIMSGRQWSSSDGCCFKQIWWTRFSDCAWPGAPLGLYVILQMIRCVDVSWASSGLADPFDRRKKDSSECTLEEDQEKFEDLPATISLHYALEAPAIVVNLVSLFAIRKHPDFATGSKWTDWGQSAQLVSCIYGLFHWLYLLTSVQLFQSEDSQADVEQGGDRDNNGDRSNHSKRGFRVMFNAVVQGFNRCMEWVFVFLAPDNASAQTLARELFKKSNAANHKIVKLDVAALTLLNESLHTSVTLGDAFGATEALQQGAEIDSEVVVEGNAISPIFSAIKHKQNELLRLLLKHGAALYAWSDESERNVKQSALHFAAEHDNADAIDIIVSRDRRFPNIYDAEANTPLIFAVAGRCVDAATALLGHGANPHDVLNTGVHNGIPKSVSSALVVATLQRDVRMMELLCRCGADPNRSGNVNRSEDGHKSVLDIALTQDNMDGVDILRRFGATWSTVQFFGTDDTDEDEHTQNDLKQQMTASSETRTQDLHDLVEKGDLAAITEVFKRGDILNSTEGGDTTPLCRAIRKNQPKIAELLLEHGASPTLSTEQDGECTIAHHSALHVAARMGSVKLINFLAPKYVQQLDLYDPTFRTPLVYAIESHNRAAAESLLDLGANPNYFIKKEVDGIILRHTPLMVATIRDKINMTDLLCKREASLNLVGETLESLITEGARKAKTTGPISDSSKTDGIKRYTALMIATRRNNLAVMELLCAHRADVNLATDGATRAIDIAAARGSREGVELLRQHGALGGPPIDDLPITHSDSDDEESDSDSNDIKYRPIVLSDSDDEKGDSDPNERATERDGDKADPEKIETDVKDPEKGDPDEADPAGIEPEARNPDENDPEEKDPEEKDARE